MTTLANKVSDPAERAALINATRTKGDQYNSAARAGLAHELAVRFNDATGKFDPKTQVTLSESTGFDASTVNRVALIVKSDKASRNAALKFKVESLSDSDLSAAIKLGSKFTRAAADAITKGKNAGKTPKAPAVKDELADITAWLLTATDDQYEPRKALLANLLATIDGQRADLAAEEASADLADAETSAVA